MDPQPPLQTTPPEPPPKHFPVLTALLSSLVLLSLLSTAYLAYQNMQLQKQITELSTPAPVSSPSPTPTSDVTADWKTYVSKELGLSFGYPSDWTAQASPSAITNAAHDRIIMLGILDQNMLNAMGVNYCEAHPEDTKTCETMQVDNKRMAISWNDSAFNVTVVTEKGTLTITMTSLPENLNPPKLTAEDKIFFRTYLLTFKFLESATAAPTPSTTYTCPLNGWQNCMPILSKEGKKACSVEAMAWYKANCPGFKGGAL